MQGDETARSEALAASWNENAANWTAAVREGLIPSRQAGTDEAILAAITKHQPARFLDVGCGEGWLVRRVVQAIGCEAVGVDGTAQLVQDARRADPQNRYEVITYRRLMDGAADLGAAFDVIAFNYALFDEQTPELLTAVQRYLSSDGVIIIQTIHPWAAAPEGQYRDGWRHEDFAAFKNQDWAAMPWFCRTLASWHGVVRAAGLVVLELSEPAAESGGLPLSLLLSCGIAGERAGEACQLADKESF
jgi:2-polyprenyl-3-methyl-5-hydroxy-6-metoxy-1,4-benzoquinol methylase